MKFNLGDIVRFKDNSYSLGLHEITHVYNDGSYLVTNDECFSEFPVKEENLILVCIKDSRLDI